MNRTFQIGNGTDTSLRFTRDDEQGFTDYGLEARLQGVTLQDSSMWFDHPEQFIAAFAEFERSRCGAATLTATPQFMLTTEPDGSTGGVWVSFSFCREHYLGPSQSSAIHRGGITMKGGFALPGEIIAKTLEDFRHFFSDATNVA